MAVSAGTAQTADLLNEQNRELVFVETMIFDTFLLLLLWFFNVSYYSTL
jgi:hypothetical protein